ncbi:hypothetical protein GCM10025858_19270 [Alicyclobacillus sacchari]|nr:hypothetical protein GCM10025858_19270 [Alicyclobacillus sacchari]
MTEAPSGSAMALQEAVHEMLRRAQGAKRTLFVASTKQKNEALREMGKALWAECAAILAANMEDVAAAREANQPEARIDRLALDERRVRQMVDGLAALIELPDPVGERMEHFVRPNGLDIRKVRVPMGVIAMIYEARPNVTVDAAGLAVKTGNVAVLRGGREALKSNQAIVRALHRGLAAAGLPQDAVLLVERTERETVDMLIRARGLVDLAIPRGGEGLIRRVVENAIVRSLRLAWGTATSMSIRRLTLRRPQP